MGYIYASIGIFFFIREREILQQNVIKSKRDTKWHFDIKSIYMMKFVEK